MKSTNQCQLPTNASGKTESSSLLCGSGGKFINIYLIFHDTRSEVKHVVQCSSLLLTQKS